MIKKLRRQFILIATAAILIIMTALVTLSNAAMSEAVNLFIDNVTDSLLGLPNSHDDFFSERLIGALNNRDVFYYEITSDSNYQVTSYDDSHHPQSLNRYTAQKLIDTAQLSSNHRFEYNNNYYAWISESENSSTVYTIIDYTMMMQWVHQIRRISFLVGLVSFIIFEILIIALSGKAIQPALENAEKQKRFITNASHELKTPVAIISADNEVIETLHGSDEWTTSISNQVTRLNSLISALVQLSKSSEMEKIELADSNISSIVDEHVESFRTLIESSNLKLEKDIAADIHAKTNAKVLGEIIDILLDNASKYCDEKGMIKAEVSKSSTHAFVIISNDYKDGKNVDYTKFFERFYRGDTSHNSEKKGFGVGLSIADELTQTMNAKIKADWKDGRIYFIVTI